MSKVLPLLLPLLLSLGAFAQTQTTYTVQKGASVYCAGTPSANIDGWFCYMEFYRNGAYVEETLLQYNTFYRWNAATGQQIAFYNNVTGSVDLTNQFLHFDFSNSTSSGHVDVGYIVIPRTCRRYCNQHGCSTQCRGPFTQISSGVATISP